jgi:hypothetical protein
VTPETGEFEIRWPVSPARYWLVAYLVRNNAPWYFSKRPLELAGGVAAMDVAMGAGFQVHGTVGVEDRRGNIDLHALRVTLRPLDLPLDDFFLPSEAVAADGAFALDYIGPDRYAVNMTGVPAGFYLKSIRSGEHDVLENGLDVTREAPAGVEIVLSGNPGGIQGQVRSEDGKPAAGATVALVPQSAGRRLRADWYRSVTTGQDGHFQLTSLPPGEYRLFAWDEVEDGAWMDPEFLQPMEGKSLAVTVGEGTSETLLLELKP